MWEYLFKSTACLLAFYLFFQYILEQQQCHTFKRFYLLGTSVFSLLIPLLTLPDIVPLAEMTATSIGQVTIYASEANIESASGYLQLSQWKMPLYLAGFSIFLFLFIYNLFRLLQNIWLHPKEVEKNHTKVLLSEPLIPHSFFRYIFLNRNEVAENKIPYEVILHEEQHILQYHSIDILVLELFKTILWFNPLLWLILRKIRLNHEFLADRAVIQKGTPIGRYQKSLLHFSSPKNQPAFAHAINYSSIKKRMEIMKTTKTKTPFSWRTFLLLPLSVLLLYSFSGRNTQIGQSAGTDELKSALEINSGHQDTPRNTLQDGASKAQIQEYNKLARKYNEMPEDEMVIDKREVERMYELYNIMSQPQRKRAEPFPALPPPPPAPERALKPSRTPAPPAPPAGIVPPRPPKPEHPDMGSKLRRTPPPPPPNPVEHIKELIEAGAFFYYQGEEISDKAALKLVQSDKLQSIKVDQKGLGAPKVVLE